MRIISSILFFCVGIFSLTVLGVHFFGSTFSLEIEEDTKIPSSNNLLELEQHVLQLETRLHTLEKPIFPVPAEIISRIGGLYPDTQYDIFGISLFSLPLSSYIQEKARILVFQDGYEHIKKQLSFLSPDHFTLNETNAFFGKSFFLNPIKEDEYVRIFFEYQGKTIGLETLKTNYTQYRDLLLR